MNKLDYNFIRQEGNNEIVLFINVDPSWLEQDLDITLTDSNELSVEVNDVIYLSGELAPLLLANLENNSTKTIFCDGEANFLAEIDLTPLRENNSKKIKP